MDFVDDLLGAPEIGEVVEITKPAELVRAPPRRNLAQEKRDRLREKIKAQEDRILEKAMATIESAMDAPDIDPAQHNPDNPNYLPEGWIERFRGDVDKASRAYRVALAAWQSKVPAFLKIASDQVIGITKARATEKGGNRTLNVQMIKLAVNAQSFPVIDVESE